MVTIVKATVKDINAIQQIAYTTWSVAYKEILSKEQMDYMLQLMYSTAALEQQLNNNHIFFLVKDNNEAIGFASVSKEEDVYKLNKLYVLPQQHGKGLGKQLLQQVITYVKEQNGNKLQLQVNRYNNAKDFYLKNGFTILYQADFDIGNGYFMNDYVMELTV